jgi:hypothetical protein
MRAASSKGAADLIVLWPPEYSRRFTPAMRASVWLVQCKRDGKLPKQEREALLDIGERTGARPVLAKTGDNGRGVVFVPLDNRGE